MATSQKAFFNRSVVRNALRQWNNLAQLGRHPLVQLNVVQDKHRRQQRDFSSMDYGRSLRDILREAIDQLKPDNTIPKEDRAWWPYLILKQEFVDGKGDKKVEEDLKLKTETGRTYQ